MEDGIERYKYFMRFLLEGGIIPSLRALRVSPVSLSFRPWDHPTDALRRRSPVQDNLSGKPSQITGPTPTQHKVLAFLQALSANKICNRQTLLAKWYSERALKLPSTTKHVLMCTLLSSPLDSKTQPKFLLAEMKLWVNFQSHELLEQLWSKINASS